MVNSLGSSSSSSSAALNPAAAAAEAVARFAAVAGELRPLLPELLPGVAHTGELFLRAFVRRAALRVAEAFSASDDYEKSMAALGFMPGATAGFSGRGLGGSSGVGFSGSSIPMSSNQFGANVPLSSAVQGFRSGAGSGVGNALWLESNLQKQQGTGPKPKAIRYSGRNTTTNNNQTSSGRSGRGSTVRVAAGKGDRAGGDGGDVSGVSGLPTAGQLVTGLVAVPLLMVLTPLAILHEQQRKRN
jgi:hypothetical protein